MNSVYSLKALLTKQPVVVAGAVRQGLSVLVLMGAIALNVEQLAGISLFLELALGLFVWSSVVPSAKVKEEQLTVVEEAAPEDPPPPPVLGDAP